MKLLHIGTCEAGDCEGLEGDHCQLWLLKRMRLCWFCWRARLDLPTDHATIAKQFGEAFAEMVTMKRAFGGKQRGAA